jgi:hypothetical protein
MLKLLVVWHVAGLNGGIGNLARISHRRASTRVSMRWSFYICSGGGTADELFFREFDLEFFQEFGVFVHFLA